jgi:hypothetical protein
MLYEEASKPEVPRLKSFCSSNGFLIHEKPGRLLLAGNMREI